MIGRALAALALAGVATLPGTSADAATPQLLGVAAANGVRVGVVIEHFLVVSDVVDAGGPAAQALIDAFGDSKGYAAYPYPGEIVLTAHGLSQGAAPEYPLIAQSSYPTAGRSSVSNGPYALTATSTENASAADAAATADGGVASGRTHSTASAVRDPASGVVTAQGESTLEGLSFGGVLSIGRVHARVRVVSAPGAAPKKTSETEFGDVTVAGQQVGLTDKGLVLPGTTVPLPPDSTANAALSAAGVTVHYLAGYSAGPTAVAPGVAVSVVQDVPGAGRTTVTYTLGQVSATAQAGGVASTGSVLPPVGSPQRPGLPLSSGTTAAAAPPVATAPGQALPAAAQPPVAAPQPGAPGPAVAAPAYRGAGLTTGPSAVSLYAVVAIGAVVMAGAAQLFRVLAVRLAWT